jgi:lipoprotein-anchoring transpeptidase ErfK/SrfK
VPSRRAGWPVALLAAVVLAGCGSTTGRSAAVPIAADSVPAFVAESADRPRVAKDAAARGRWLTARLRRATSLRAAPGGRVVARLDIRTEFDSPRVLGVVRRRGNWLQVLATELPNGKRAWIRAADARLRATAWSIHVDRSARRLVLRRGGRLLERMPVAVGRAGTPTPLGRFTVTDELRPARSDSPYGCCILALSGRQTRLVEGWPGGDRLAIHATPQVETIGEAASLGCLRARTADMRVLMRRVPLGTPVFVRA